MVNAADPKSIDKKSKADKLHNSIEVADVRFLLGTQQGRRYVWRHLTNAGIFETSFTGNSTTFFNEGKRAVGLKMLAEVMEANPEAYVVMMSEAKADNSDK